MAKIDLNGIDTNDEKQVADAIVFLSQFVKAAAPAVPSTARGISGSPAAVAAPNKPKRGRPRNKVKDANGEGAGGPEPVAPVPHEGTLPAAAAVPVPSPAAPAATHPADAKLVPGVHEGAKPGVFDDMKDDLPAKPVTVPMLGDVQAAIEKLVGRKGLPFTRELLSRYGVQRGRDLLDKQRAEFIKEAYDLAAEPTR